MKNNNNRPSPPNLLSGILVSCIGITLGILAITWFMINRQVESLVINRTSEYAHSIAKIAADSSAEALLSDDKIQLNLIVQTIAKDPYIKQATIFSVDGQIVSQHPEESELAGIKKPSDLDPELGDVQNDAGYESDKEVEKQPGNQSSKVFLKRGLNKIVTEEIYYQNVIAGWFKIEIDRSSLEKNFKGSFNHILIITGSVSLFLFAFLIYLLFRFESTIKKLASYCQHLLIQNKITPPRKKNSWIESVKRLSESHEQHLKTQVTLPLETAQWTSTRMLSKVLICRLEFEIVPLDDRQLSEDISLAEEYLNKSVQTFGIQAQGDILTGCLVPFEDQVQTHHDGSYSSIHDALCFITLIKQLLATLSTPIEMKFCISRANILQLEDQYDTITGISIVDKTRHKISRLLVDCAANEAMSLSIPITELEDYAEVTPLEYSEDNIIHAYRLKIKESKFSQRVSRQYNYIKEV